MSDVTRILNAIEGGDPKATEALLPLVYGELRLLAAQKMAQERPGQTLQATALVHEVYIRLLEGESQSFNSRGHFYKAAAEAMRRILIENARRKKSAKRGGDLQKIELSEAAIAIENPSDDLLAVDEALDRSFRWVFLYESTGRIRRAIYLSIHRCAATAHGLCLSTRHFGIHCLNTCRTSFLPDSRLTIEAKGHIDAQTSSVSSVDICIRVLLCSFCQCKETMCYGKCDGSEDTCKTDDQE